MQFNTFKGKLLIDDKEIKIAIKEYYERRGFKFNKIDITWFYLDDGVPSEGVGWDLDKSNRFQLKCEGEINLK